MRSLLGGGALLLVAGFMLLGFLRSGATLGAASTWVALLLTVGVPGAAGGYLLLRHFGASRLRDVRRDQLRRQTLESEVLRLAGAHGGRLALVDVVSEMAVSSDDAQAALEGLVSREIADIAVTDAGTLVYTFRDIERAADKSSARNVLE